MYEEHKAGSDGDDYICTGWVEVAESVSSYRTRPKRLRCV
jgi:hypothetical protein